MIITSKSTDSYVAKEAGGKGSNLYLMSKQGFSIPEWFIVSANIYHQFKLSNNIHEKIEDILEQDISFKQMEDQIRELIIRSPLSKSTIEMIHQAYQKLNKKMISVRSSALDEDSSGHSFAGQLSSYLFIKNFEDALRFLKLCWASAYSERGLSYRKENGISFSKIGVAVIFQEMISCEKSGVVFTCDPINGDPDKILINSVYGVGEGLVSGLLDADTYTIDKNNGQIIHKEIVTKDEQLVQDQESGHCKTIQVREELQNESSLTDLEIKLLFEQSVKIENYYHLPQDIEWGIQNNKLYILQSRPVTTPVKTRSGTLYIWDNSNIIESYGGLTLPLTTGFARYVYHQVYVQFCEVLMVPQKHIKNMDYFLQNMLGIFYGRIYYNLLNWYKLTSILPGFKYNRQFMETMMGTSESLSNEIADRIKPPAFQESLASKIRRLITGFKFFYFHITIQSLVDNFLKYFHVVYNQFRKIDYSKLPSDQIYIQYQLLEQQLLRHWKAPIINDFLCMVHFGIFKKLTANWLAEHGPSIQNDLLCGDGNLESAEPTKELMRMAEVIQNNKSLRELLLANKNEDCLEALNQSTHQDFYQRVQSYIDRFGFRCMSEMKLEQKDLHHDPSFLFVCLKNYLNQPDLSLEAYEKREKEIRNKAEDKVNLSLQGLKKIIYGWSLKNARQAVRNRENTRFCRTRIYGVVRGMFYGIGKDFAAKGIIEKQEDIFYISLDELKGSLEGHCTIQDFKKVIALRKEQYSQYENIEPAPRFLTRGPVYWLNEHTPKEVEVDTSDLPPNALKGIGCCPGTVEKKVRVIINPDDDMTLNGEILVTMRTDPGWIPLYPSIGGLLVERGGLLSHSAIVAREMGIPTIVGIKGLTSKIKDGMTVRFNGETGIIEVID